MKTIATSTIELMESNKAKFIGFTSVWDYHNSQIGQNKNSQVYNDVLSAFKSNKKAQRILVLVGAKGRSAHSKTEMLIFDITNMSVEDELNSGCYTIGDEFFRHIMLKEKNTYKQPASKS